MKSFVLAGLCITIPALALAYSNNPPNGKTGAPGEGTCRDCHASFGLNSGPGVLRIEAPEAFAPGVTYRIVVAIEHAGQSRWGFEFTPLAVGACGIIEPTTTQIETQGDKTYVKQTAAGTFQGVPNAAGWAFNWTAPAHPPEVVAFYAVANAADNNGSTSGDYVYTSSLQIPLAQGVDDGMPIPDSEILFNSPNPVRGRAVTTFLILEPGEVHLGIYDVAGSMVACLVSEWRPAGTWTIPWDASQVRAAGGIYVCRLSAGSSATARPLVILR